MEILGFQISKAKKFGLDNDDDKVIIPSFVPPIDDSGASPVSNGGGYYGSYLDFDGTAKSEIELIAKYREAAMYPDADNAIEEICNESIGAEDDETVVKIFLDKVELSKSVKLKIEASFEEVKQLLDFEAKAHDIFKRWYIDGRVYYHKMTDPKRPQAGIQELRFIDPRKIKKIREITKAKDSNTGVEVVTKTKDYFLYSETPLKKQNAYSNSVHNSINGIKIDPEAIAYVTSGLIDLDKHMVLGHLHKAIKPINMLKLAEDSMLIFRLSRAPSRRVFYIDVGNLPKPKAEQYLKDTMERYRNKIVYDACLAMDTMIPLLDGRTLSIKDIQTEFEKGERLWAYSCDPITGKFSPGLISSAGVTKFNQKVMKITLDNDETITCTYDHKFPVWNKGKVEAQNLIVGDSMIPFYNREKEIHGSKSPYEQIFDNDTKKWLYTHREVSKWKDENNLVNEMVYKTDHEFKNTVHHKNYDRYNNNPENLSRMNRDDHFDYHTQHNSLAGKIGGKISGPINGKRCREYCDSHKFKNHKITKIEFLDETMDVGTLGIDKDELYHGNHTFALASGIYTCNSTGEVKDDRKHMSMLEDFWLPRRGGDAGTKIDNLEGITNTNQKEEVEYYLNRVYSTMNVPLSRLTQGTTMNFGKQAEITQDELKFAKFISRLRRKFSDLFNDLLRTQVVLTGICSVEDWDNLIKPFIKYNFAADIYWKEAKELEILHSRIELLSAIDQYVGIYYSKDFVKKKILCQTDDEIESMQQQINDEQEEQLRDAQFKGQIDGAQQAATMEMMPQEPAPTKK